jgi:ribosomal small subunit protein bTHX
MFADLLLALRAATTSNRGKTMGKGDRKTRKGKIRIRSYGNVRSHAAKVVKKTGVVKKTVGPKAAPAKKPAPAAAKKKP